MDSREQRKISNKEACCAVRAAAEVIFN